MALTNNEVRMILDNDGVINIWFVIGYPNYAYPVKIAAESAARDLHPGMDTNSVVYYRRFYIEQEI